MRIRRYHIYLADLNPRYGSEPGKTGPVVVAQTDLLNAVHPSTVICPVTTDIVREASFLRVHLDAPENNLVRPSDILVDQIRAMDNRRFRKQLGILTTGQKALLKRNLRVLLFS